MGRKTLTLSISLGLVVGTESADEDVYTYEDVVSCLVSFISHCFCEARRLCDFPISLCDILPYVLSVRRISEKVVDEFSSILRSSTNHCGIGNM